MKEHSTVQNVSDVSHAVDVLGSRLTGQVCGVTQSAVKRWRQRNKLPRTDATGETKYAEKIANAINGLGFVTCDAVQLLNCGRS